MLAVLKTVQKSKKNGIKQKGIPVKVKDAQFKTVICDKDFSKYGYRIGEIFSFRGMGYLGNINSDEKVVLVTDQLVIFREIGSDSLHYYTCDELKELKQYGKILIAC